jgi:hypothetical protein
MTTNAAHTDLVLSPDAAAECPRRMRGKSVSHPIDREKIRSHAPLRTPRFSHVYTRKYTDSNGTQVRFPLLPCAPSSLLHPRRISSLLADLIRTHIERAEVRCVVMPYSQKAARPHYRRRLAAVYIQSVTRGASTRFPLPPPHDGHRFP